MGWPLKPTTTTPKWWPISSMSFLRLQNVFNLDHLLIIIICHCNMAEMRILLIFWRKNSYQIHNHNNIQSQRFKFQFCCQVSLRWRTLLSFGSLQRVKCWMGSIGNTGTTPAMTSKLDYDYHLDDDDTSLSHYVLHWWWGSLAILGILVQHRQWNVNLI